MKETRYISKLVKIIYEKEKVIEQLKRERREWETRRGGAGVGEGEMKEQIRVQSEVIGSLTQQMKDMEQRIALLANELPSENLQIDEQKQIPKLSSPPQSLQLPPPPSKHTQDTSQLWRKQYEQSRREIEELKIENHRLRLEITSMDNQLQTTLLKTE